MERFTVAVDGSGRILLPSKVRKQLKLKKGSELIASLNKHELVLNTRAEVCTACDNSCLMHMQGMLHRQFAGVRTLHIAEVLAGTEDAPA